MGIWVGGSVVGELESNAEHSFQLLGKTNVGQQILRFQEHLFPNSKIDIFDDFQ